MGAGLGLGAGRRLAATALLVSGLVALAPVAGLGRAPAEPLLRDLPPGVFLERSVPVAGAQQEAIGRKLGAGIDRLSNNFLRVHGRAVQVNFVTAEDEAGARKIQAAIGKRYPYALRRGEVVVEYVGRHLDDALALKTSYELGLVEKPAAVRYSLSAILGAVDQADYMSCNPLFNHFLALGRGGPGKGEAKRAIAALVPRFKFGRSLQLRSPALGTGGESRYSFVPENPEVKQEGAVVRVTFDRLTSKLDVPFCHPGCRSDGGGLRVYPRHE